MSAIASALCGQLSGTVVFIAMSLKARDMVIAASSGDWGEMASEDFFLYRNFWDGQGWRGDGDPSPQFWIQCVAMGDSGSILRGGRDWTDDADRSPVFWSRCAAGDSDSILWGGREWTDDQSLSDARSAAHFDFRDCSDGEFDPSLDVDRLAADLKSIPDSDIPRDPELRVGGSVLGHAFGGRDDSQRRGDIYFPGGAFQNIYLRAVAVWRE